MTARPRQNRLSGASTLVAFHVRADQPSCISLVALQHVMETERVFKKLPFFIGMRPPDDLYKARLKMGLYGCFFTVRVHYGMTFIFISLMNRSVSGVRRLSTWRCPHLLLSAGAVLPAVIDRYHLQQDAQQQTRRPPMLTDGRTDGHPADT